MDFTEPVGADLSRAVQHLWAEAGLNHRLVAAQAKEIGALKLRLIETSAKQGESIAHISAIIEFHDKLASAIKDLSDTVASLRGFVEVQQKDINTRHDQALAANLRLQELIASMQERALRSGEVVASWGEALKMHAGNEGILLKGIIVSLLITGSIVLIAANWLLPSLFTFLVSSLSEH